MSLSDSKEKAMETQKRMLPSEQKPRLFMFTSKDEIKEFSNWYENTSQCQKALSFAIGGLYHGISNLFRTSSAGEALSQCKVLSGENTRNIQIVEIRNTLTFNALICTLSTFTFLESLASSQVRLPVDTSSSNDAKSSPERFIQVILEKKSEGYIHRCLESMLTIGKAKKNVQPLPYSCFVPIVQMMVEDEKEAIANRDNKKAKADDKKNNNNRKNKEAEAHDIEWTWDSLSKKISTLINDDCNNGSHNKSKYVQLSNELFEQLYDLIINAVQVGSKTRVSSPDVISCIVTEFIVETVFHVHALISCERELTSVIDRIEHANEHQNGQGKRITQEIKKTMINESCPPMFKLILRDTIPLVFGIHNLDFSRYLDLAKCYFTKYTDFVKQTIGLTYIVAQGELTKVGTEGIAEKEFVKICKTACRLLRECLQENYSDLLHAAKDEIDNDLSNKVAPVHGRGEQIIARTISAYECFKRIGFICYYPSEDTKSYLCAINQINRYQSYAEYLAKILDIDMDPLQGIIPAVANDRGSPNVTLDHTIKDGRENLIIKVDPIPFDRDYSWSLVNDEQVERFKNDPGEIRREFWSESTVYGLFSFIRYPNPEVYPTFLREGKVSGDRPKEEELKKLFIRVDCKDAKTKGKIIHNPSTVALGIVEDWKRYESIRPMFNPFVRLEDFKAFFSEEF